MKKSFSIKADDEVALRITISGKDGALVGLLLDKIMDQIFSVSEIGRVWHKSVRGEQKAPISTSTSTC